MNKEFYEEYDNGLTFKIHFMRWIFGLFILSPFAVVSIAAYFGITALLYAIIGIIFFGFIPYLFGGMFYDIYRMDKAGVRWK